MCCEYELRSAVEVLQSLVCRPGMIYQPTYGTASNVEYTFFQALVEATSLRVATGAHL